MAKDISGIIQSLQATAVNRCRERLELAACRAHDLMHGDEQTGDRPRTRAKPEYGVTSVLKRRHGL